MKNLVIIGAGRLGKGFVGETFANAPNWETTFIDIDKHVIQAMNMEGKYLVHVHRRDRVDAHTVSNYHAYTWDNVECIKSIVEADLLIFTIYPEQIEDAIKSVSDALHVREKDNPLQKLTMIFITNKNYLIPGILSSFESCLGKDSMAWFCEQVVIRDSIVRRSTDAKDHVSLNIRTTAVLSLLIQKPLNIDVSDVEWLDLTDHLEVLKDVKVFIVNGPHAASAFMGYYLGYETINEISADKRGKKFVAEVTEEIKQGILKSYPLTEKQLNELSLFPEAKGEMVDYIYRVAFDPIRKLSNNDRLVGSALMCYKHGLAYEHIATAMAYGFLYDNPEDEQAMKLQSMIQAKGIEYAILQVTGLEQGHDIVHMVINKYQELIK